jgi:hypothetical protein
MRAIGTRRHYLYEPAPVAPQKAEV